MGYWKRQMPASRRASQRERAPEGGGRSQQSLRASTNRFFHDRGIDQIGLVAAGHVQALVGQHIEPAHDAARGLPHQEQRIFGKDFTAATPPAPSGAEIGVYPIGFP